MGYSAQSRTQREATTCLARLHATPPGKQATTQQPQPIALGGGATKFQHFQDFCQSTRVKSVLHPTENRYIYQMLHETGISITNLVPSPGTELQIN